MLTGSKNRERSIDKLVRESRNLRDHLLRIDGQDSLELVDALRPFAPDKDRENVADADVNTLSSAFQNAYDKALTAIDDYTLNEVLSGRSPHLQPHHAFSSPLLAFIGFLLVVSAFHYSYWANRTTFVLREAEEFVSFDHFGTMMQLVELENYYEKSGVEGNADLEPQLIYLEQFSSLKNQYNSEVWLPERMAALATDFNPVAKWINQAKRHYCGTNGPLVRFLSCPQAVPATAVSGSILETIRKILRSEPQVKTRTNNFRESLLEIARIEGETMKAAGRDIASTYAQSRYFVIARMQELRERLNIVHLWALPIIYGALGSIVYCMWRVLNTNVAALGLGYAVLRTIFAGLAALTFSMLLVPSNILTIGVDLNRPIIYLMAFVFGYSIEAFVNTLNLINAYVTTNLQARNRSTG